MLEQVILKPEEWLMRSMAKNKGEASKVTNWKHTATFNYWFRLLKRCFCFKFENLVSQHDGLLVLYTTRSTHHTLWAVLSLTRWSDKCQKIVSLSLCVHLRDAFEQFFTIFWPLTLTQHFLESEEQLFALLLLWLILTFPCQYWQRMYKIHKQDDDDDDVAVLRTN